MRERPRIIAMKRRPATHRSDERSRTPQRQNGAANRASEFALTSNGGASSDHSVATERVRGTDAAHHQAFAEASAREFHAQKRKRVDRAIARQGNDGGSEDVCLMPRTEAVQGNRRAALTPGSKKACAGASG